MNQSERTQLINAAKYVGDLLQERLIHRESKPPIRVNQGLTEKELAMQIAKKLAEKRNYTTEVRTLIQYYDGSSSPVGVDGTHRGTYERDEVKYYVVVTPEVLAKARIYKIDLLERLAYRRDNTVSKSIQEAWNQEYEKLMWEDNPTLDIGFWLLEELEGKLHSPTLDFFDRDEDIPF
ncbi:hypothetical protein ACFKIX_002443 [Vibrio alginolyticus]